MGIRITLLGLAFASLLATTAYAAPLQMVVTFSIKDYEAWRPVFDEAAPARAKDGVSGGQVYRSADQPNQLLVVFDVASEKSGRAWMASPQVRAAWTKGGVLGTPAYRFAR